MKSPSGVHSWMLCASGLLYRSRSASAVLNNACGDGRHARALREGIVIAPHAIPTMRALIGVEHQFLGNLQRFSVTRRLAQPRRLRHADSRAVVARDQRQDRILHGQRKHVHGLPIDRHAPLDQRERAGDQRQLFGQIFFTQWRGQGAERPERQQIPDVVRGCVIVDEERPRPLRQRIDVPVREALVLARPAKCGSPTAASLPRCALFRHTHWTTSC